MQYMIVQFQELLKVIQILNINFEQHNVMRRIFKGPHTIEYCVQTSTLVPL